MVPNRNRQDPMPLSFVTLFTRPPIIGVVHLRPLPGSPRAEPIEQRPAPDGIPVAPLMRGVRGEEPRIEKVSATARSGPAREPAAESKAREMSDRVPMTRQGYESMKAELSRLQRNGPTSR